LKKCTASTFCYDVGWSHQRIVVGPYLYDLWKFSGDVVPLASTKTW
jgi:hypothetical protein